LFMVIESSTRKSDKSRDKVATAGRPDWDAGDEGEAGGAGGGTCCDGPVMGDAYDYGARLIFYDVS
jgi:hypothetical protein